MYTYMYIRHTGSRVTCDVSLPRVCLYVDVVRMLGGGWESTKITQPLQHYARGVANVYLFSV
jgi:hypothetical protein